MKTIKSLVLALGLIYVTVGSAAYAAAGETPRVNRVQMEIAEKGLDATLQRFTSDNTRTLIGLSVRGAERWYEPSKRQPLPIATPAGLVFSPGFPRPRNPDKALRAAAFAGWILAPTFSLRSPEELAELALRFTKPR